MSSWRMFFIPDPGSGPDFLPIPDPDHGSWILDPGSWIPDHGSRIIDPGSWIPDPGSRIMDPGSWIPDPGSRILDPGVRKAPDLDPVLIFYPSQIRIMDPRSWIPDHESQIPDPGVKKAPDPGSRILDPDPDPQHWRFRIFSGCREKRRALLS